MNWKNFGLGFLAGTATTIALGYHYVSKIVKEAEDEKNYAYRFYKNKEDGLIEEASSETYATIDELRDALSQLTEPDSEEERYELAKQNVDLASEDLKAYSLGLEATKEMNESRNAGLTIPVMITREEFDNGCKSYDKRGLMYYVLDDCLVDDEHNLVHYPDKVVGVNTLTNFGAPFLDDPDVLYVRNGAFAVDYEVARIDGAYAVEVLGQDPEGFK